MDNIAAFICPITGEIFSDPVIASDGHTYERLAIQEWLGRHASTSPMTREVISISDLRPNHVVRKWLEEWYETYSSTSAQAVQCSIPFEELTLGLGIVGRGSFKVVQRGRWQEKVVAVATTRDGAAYLTAEAYVLRRYIDTYTHSLS